MGHFLGDIFSRKRKSNRTIHEEEYEPIDDLTLQKKVNATNEIWIDSPNTMSTYITMEFSGLSSHLRSIAAFGQVDRAQ